jgi:hypothetical protein
LTKRLAIRRGVVLAFAVTSFGCEEARLLFVGLTDVDGTCTTVVTDRHLDPPFAGAKQPDLRMKKKLEMREVLVWEIVSNCAQPQRVSVKTASNAVRMIVKTGFSLAEPMTLTMGQSVVGVFARSATDVGVFDFDTCPAVKGVLCEETPQLQIEVVP